MLPALDLDYVRAQFPALAGDWVFFDNAGGSQTLATVAERISDYLLTSNVQLGASYAVSQQSGARVRDAHLSIAELIGAARPDDAAIKLPQERCRKRSRLEQDDVAGLDAGRVADEDVGQTLEPGISHVRRPRQAQRGR